MFYEYFHGDNGAGIGASHQTGWTGIVAPLMDYFARVDADAVLENEAGRMVAKLVRDQVDGTEAVTAIFLGAVLSRFAAAALLKRHYAPRDERPAAQTAEGR